MVEFLLLVLFCDWASKVPFGYKEVPVKDIEARGYDPTNLDDVNEYYEQLDSGYFDL